MLVQPSIYEKIDINPLETAKNKIISILDDLVINKCITKKLRNSLMDNDSKLGTFRILFKLHKNDLGLRPIVNCANHLTSNHRVLYFSSCFTSIFRIIMILQSLHYR